MQRAFDDAIHALAPSVPQLRKDGVADYLSGLFGAVADEMLEARGVVGGAERAARGSVEDDALESALELVFGDGMGRHTDRVVSEVMARLRAPDDDDDDDDDDDEDDDEGAAPGPAPGDRCLAVLDEDGEWHEAVVDEVLPGGGGFAVTFSEFGKPQRVARVVTLGEAVGHRGDSDGEGGDWDACELCARVMPLTAHHLRPREMHRRLRRKGFTQAVLNRCAMICRGCHSAVHRLADNKTLTSDYHSVELLRGLPGLAAWTRYAAKQHPSSRRIAQQARSHRAAAAY